MRKIIGSVLLGLGAFLLVGALLASFWVPGQVKKTPLDVDSTTRLDGTADKLNPETGDLETIPVKATSVTRADADRSDDEVIVWVNTTCLVIDEGDVPDCVDDKDPQKRLVSASEDVFATDRVTAMSVNGQYLTAEEKEGLVNKFPFDTEKKTYPYWDSMLDAPVDATYEGTEEIDGLEVYKFHILVENEQAEVVEGTDGVYSQDKYIYVEPLTGAIVNQTQHEVRVLEDGTKILDLDLGFTDEQVSTGAKESKDNADKIRLLTETVPLVGYIAGGLALLIGLVLVLTSRKKNAA
ncbi:MAG: DUF3068 domain-containing protein [Nocardioides sp.]|nr:DUF3068 domain-containing protein [Nocardioides sp.]